MRNTVSKGIRSGLVGNALLRQIRLFWMRMLRTVDLAGLVVLATVMAIGLHGIGVTVSRENGGGRPALERYRQRSTPADVHGAVLSLPYPERCGAATGSSRDWFGGGLAPSLEGRDRCSLRHVTNRTMP